MSLSPSTYYEKISRKDAIKRLFVHAKNKGWTKEEMYQYFREWGYGEVELHSLSAKILGEILKVIKWYTFVEEDPRVTLIEKQYSSSGINPNLVYQWIKKRYNKDTIYHLDDNEFKSVMAMLGQYKKKNNRQVMKNL